MYKLNLITFNFKYFLLIFFNFNFNINFKNFNVKLQIKKNQFFNLKKGSRKPRLRPSGFDALTKQRFSITKRVLFTVTTTNIYTYIRIATCFGLVRQSSGKLRKLQKSFLFYQ
jgi:hypothetical protein